MGNMTGWYHDAWSKVLRLEFSFSIVVFRYCREILPQLTGRQITAPRGCVINKLFRLCEKCPTEQCRCDEGRNASQIEWMLYAAVAELYVSFSTSCRACESFSKTSNPVDVTTIESRVQMIGSKSVRQARCSASKLSSGFSGSARDSCGGGT